MGKHLTFEQRCKLHALLGNGLSQAAMAAVIGTSQSAVSRELARNVTASGYGCQAAQAQAEFRRASVPNRPRKMTTAVISLIETQLRHQQWSPQQISDWLAQTHGISISHERIYQHIWADKQAGGTLFSQLRRSGKKYNTRANKLAGRGIIPGRIDIKQRPEIVEKRIRIGDWEVDTIMGSGHSGVILSVVDRRSRYTILVKLQAATAELVCRAIVIHLRRHGAPVHTITADNGKEFARHQQVAKALKAEFYFATPYHAWERGLNENTNGLVRQYFPKGSSFADVTQTAVRRVQNKLNSRPRKVLGYKTPDEAFRAC